MSVTVYCIGTTAFILYELRPKRPQTKTATAKTATCQTKTATLKIQNGHKPKWSQPKRPHDVVIWSANTWTNNFPLTNWELLEQALKPRQK